jgi:hypothetical protein
MDVTAHLQTQHSAYPRYAVVMPVRRMAWLKGCVSNKRIDLGQEETI